MAAAIGLRNAFDASSLRAIAKRAKDGPQARRLVALAAIYDGAARSEAAKIGGVGLQVVRDWVLRFNAEGPQGLVNRKAPGQPSRLNDASGGAWLRSSRAGRRRRSMTSCAGGSSISGSEFSKSSGSRSPSRR